MSGVSKVGGYFMKLASSLMKKRTDGVAKDIIGKRAKRAASKAKSENAKVSHKRKTDAEVEAIERDFKMPRSQRHDKAARQLGSDKSSPIKSGGGLNAAIIEKVEGSVDIKGFKAKKEYARLKKALLRFDKEGITNDPARNKIMKRLFKLEKE